MSYGFKVIAEGDYACFTRPEMKVERVSYDVPTPGALEGMLKSVYWKPAIRYVIDEIVVFNRINFMNIRRNEIKEKLNLSAAKKQMSGKANDISIYASENRTQRASMILKDVKYGIAFHFEMTGIMSFHNDECEEKHYNIIKRRLQNGQAFRTPCFGCSEFAVKHLCLVDEFDYSQIDAEIMHENDVDLGFMLYGVKFKDKGFNADGTAINDEDVWKKHRFSDKAEPIFYRPHMKKGVINVAEYAKEVIC